MKALLQPGDKVVAIFPAYQSLHELAESTGCSVRYWEPQLPTGSGQLEFRVQDVLVSAVLEVLARFATTWGIMPLTACLAMANILLPGTSATGACCLRQTSSCRLAMPAYAHASGAPRNTPGQPCAPLLPALQPLIQPGVKLVVVNFPHNPTGAMLQQADWQQLVAACAAAGAWLFSDEMYRFTGVHAMSLPAASDCNGCCLKSLAVL